MSPVGLTEAAGLESPLVENRWQTHLLPRLNLAIRPTIRGLTNEMAGSRSFSVWSGDCFFQYRLGHKKAKARDDKEKAPSRSRERVADTNKVKAFNPSR
jgi:hypothetical protein